MSKKDKGIYNKYIVSRADGKEENSRYFVLAIDKDPFALDALGEYARKCSIEYPYLANDLKLILSKKNNET